MLLTELKNTKNGKSIYKAEDRVLCGTRSPSKIRYEYSDPTKYIPEIISSCDKSGHPATLTIKYYLALNKILASMEIPILPTVIENHKYNPLFTQTYYLCETHEDTIQKTKLEKSKNLKSFNTSAKDNSNKIILYIQRALCMKYLEIKSNPPLSQDDIAILKGIESIPIIKHLNLANIKTSNIGFKKLSGLDYSISDSRSLDYDTVYNYSKKFQQEHAGTSDVEIVFVGENLTIVGLQKGRTPEEIEEYATIDAIANQVVFDKSSYDKRIIFNYTNQPQRAKPSEPSSN